MYQLVLTTCPDEEVAESIAKYLISKKLAACVNIVPNITSTYSWEDIPKLLEDACFRVRVGFEYKA